MDKIVVNLKYCYGIQKMAHEFDTSDGLAFLIYAPNGSMKSSFARVFSDISKGENPRDAIFPERQTTFSIADETNTQVIGDNILVVEPYVEGYSTQKTATLMVNEDLRREYEELTGSIEDKANTALTALGKLSGLRPRTKVIGELSSLNDLAEGDIYNHLEIGFSNLERVSNPGFGDIYYTEVFNDQVLKFLSKEHISRQLEDYVDRYNELIEGSSYFRQGLFNHNHAATISKSLADNNFFKANHSISLADREEKKIEITSQQELDFAIKEEKKQILTDPELVKKFEAIDKEITRNVELKRFRDYLVNYPEIIPELCDLNSFREKIWLSYLFNIEEELRDFVFTYDRAKGSLEKMIREAKEQETKWGEALSIFKRRFTVPFDLEVANQHNVMLKDEAPSLVFRYRDGNDQCEIGRGELLGVLSSGEKRALYLLNVIFEIEARTMLEGKTILVLDDIADSFDYKNKYAIVEYLKDILECGKFIMFILTHNFDFYRTVQSRLGINRARNCFMAKKSNDTITLKTAQYLNSPFLNWRDNLTRGRKYILALVPMVRNLVEYLDGQQSQDYIFFTSILHKKPDSNAITMASLAEKINQIMKTNVNYGTEKVIDVIFEEADLCMAENDPISLENKVIISIAIRLLAEEIMINKMCYSFSTSGIVHNQTRGLFNIYKGKFPQDTKVITTVEKVMLMTPETIHLNSFMYEPIIDMSDEHLKSLYHELIAIDG